jgi:single-stranded DNA-binding protein
MEKDGSSDFNEPTEAAPSHNSPATENKNVFAEDEDDDLPF